MNEKQYTPHPFELFGVECHKGWFDLLKPVFEYAEKYNNGKEEEKQIKFLQIKEKMGLLDIYTNFSTPELTKIIEKAKEKADNTCEECGSTTEIGTRLNGWITRMCLNCVKKEAAEKDCPQLWERKTDNKRFWVFPNQNVEEIDDFSDCEEIEDNPYLFGLCMPVEAR
jgi:hypothetical protein